VRVPVPRIGRVLVGGWSPVDPRRPDRIASLLVGVPGVRGLRYVGRVGVSGDERRPVAGLRSHRRDDSPFEGAVPPDVARDAIWVEPRMVGLVDVLEGGRREAAGEHVFASQAIRVEAKEFPTRNLRVAPRFATPPASARARIEREVSWLNALSLVAGGYTKLVKCTVAMKTVLGKNANALAIDMCDAIDKALEETKPLASEVVQKMADAWDTLTQGNAKTGEPSPHDAMLSRLLASYPQDYVKHIGQCFADVVAKLEGFEKADQAEANKAAKWSS
jgi:hypothetical protein